MRAPLLAMAGLAATAGAAEDMAIAGLDRCLAAVDATHAPALMGAMGCPGDEDRCFSTAASQADLNCLTFAADMCHFLADAQGTCLSALADHAATRAAALRTRLPDREELGADLEGFDRRRVVRELGEFDAGGSVLRAPCDPPPPTPAEPFCAYLDASVGLQLLRGAARTIGVLVEPD